MGRGGGGGRRGKINQYVQRTSFDGQGFRLRAANNAIEVFLGVFSIADHMFI